MFYRKLATTAVAVAACGNLAAQTSDLYVNHTLVRDAPQVDATAFFNDGVFDIFTDLPFTTINTLNFTNRGTMLGAPGFIFSYDADTSAGRQPADTIVNQGIIISRDSSGFGLVTDPSGGQIVLPNGGGASWIRFEATNVFSAGLLSAGTQGLLEIIAEDVDLNRAGIRTGTSPNSGTRLIEDTLTRDRSNFFNPLGITDSYWAVGSNQVVIGAGAPLRLLESPFLDVPFPQTPSHQTSTVIPGTNATGSAQLPNFSGNDQRYIAFVRTNIMNGSNALIQVVFVATNINDGQVWADVRWAVGGYGTGPQLADASAPIIEISSRSFDTVLSDFTTNSVYIIDELATRTNTFLSVNFNGTSGRPSNYRTFTGGPGFAGFGSLQGDNTPFSYFQHIYNFFWTSDVVTNRYTAYSLLVNSIPRPNLGSGFSNVPDRGFTFGNPFVENLFDPTNTPGRVVIESTGGLNLNNTRIRGERYASIVSPHVDFNDNTILDSPFLSLNLGNTNGMLKISNIIPREVSRVAGPIHIWSASWTNESVTFEFDEDTGTQISNVVTILNFVTLVDNEDLAAVQNVTTTELLLQSDEVVISDQLFVQRAFEIEASNLTFRADVDLSSEVGDIGAANFVGVVNLTNERSFFLPADSRMGDSFNPPFESFHNSGLWTSYFIDVMVDRLRNSGTLFSRFGPLVIEADEINTEQGQLLANSDLYLTCSTLTSGFSTASAGTISSGGGVPLLFPGRLYLNVVDHVDDGGNLANNNWNVTDGFEMLAKPATGDFDGTILTSTAYQFTEVTHKWGAEDRGWTQAGYIDNAFVGTLRLDGAMLSRFTFQTVTGDNALYVRYLDLRNYAATNPDDAISVEEGMRIYYGSSTVAATVLDATEAGQLGRLVFAPFGALPATTEITLASGQVFNAKDYLLNSMTIDSDADGIVNALDPSPFDEVLINVTVVNDPETRAVITWAGAPLTEYQLEYKDNVDADEWTVLDNFTTMSDRRDMTVTDEDPNSAHRYYRVIYTP